MDSSSLHSEKSFDWRKRAIQAEKNKQGAGEGVDYLC